MTIRQSWVMVVLVAAVFPPNAGAAPLFLGNAFFSIAPNSQYPIVNNQLAINNTSFGIFVAGPFEVAVPAGPSTGILLNFQVKRQLNPAFGSQLMNLQTWLVGFSVPPSTGTFLPTGGYVKSYLDISGQDATIPINLVNGAATWNINMAGPSFNYVSGTDVYLVQDFVLDGTRTSGLFDTWLIDLPVEARIVPEAGTLALVGVAGITLVAAWLARGSYRRIVGTDLAQERL